jgi:hypothetical protein
LGFAHGLQVDPTAESACLQSFNDTAVWLESVRSDAYDCLSFKIAKCIELANVLNAAIIQAQDIEIACKIQEFYDIILELKDGSLWSTLFFRFYSNQSLLIQLVTAIPALEKAGDWRQIGMNLATGLRMLLGFELR